MIQPVQGTITADFNTWVNYSIAGHPTRIHKGKTQWQHQAWDIVTDTYAPIYAPADCTIEIKVDGKHDSDMQGYGNELYVRFDDGAVMRITHLQSGIPVSNGQRVQKGALLAYTGKTGYRTPQWVIHTHLEILMNGQRVDPATYNPPTNSNNDEDMPRRPRLHARFTLCAVKDYPGTGSTSQYVVTENDRSKGYWEVKTEDIKDTIDLFHGEVDTNQRYKDLGGKKSSWNGNWSANQAAKNWPELLTF